MKQKMFSQGSLRWVGLDFQKGTSSVLYRCPLDLLSNDEYFWGQEVIIAKGYNKSGWHQKRTKNYDPFCLFVFISFRFGFSFVFASIWTLSMNPCWSAGCWSWSYFSCHKCAHVSNRLIAIWSSWSIHLQSLCDSGRWCFHQKSGRRLGDFRSSQFERNHSFLWHRQDIRLSMVRKNEWFLTPLHSDQALACLIPWCLLPKTVEDAGPARSAAAPSAH